MFFKDSDIETPFSIFLDASITANSNTLLSTTLTISPIESSTETPALIKIPNVLLNLLKVFCSIKFPKIGTFNKILSLINLPVSVKVNIQIDKIVRMKTAKIEMDRKTLAYLAMEEPDLFAQIAQTVKIKD